MLYTTTYPHVHANIIRRFQRKRLIHNLFVNAHRSNVRCRYFKISQHIIYNLILNLQNTLTIKRNSRKFDLRLLIILKNEKKTYALIFRCSLAYHITSFLLQPYQCSRLPCLSLMTILHKSFLHFLSYQTLHTSLLHCLSTK